MSPEEIEIRQRLKDDFIYYAPRCLIIRPKIGGLIPFIPNKSQLYVNSKVEEQRRLTGKVRAIMLKARQKGMSTWVGGRYYWKVTHRKGVMAFILTHEDDATNNLFKMTKTFHDHCPAHVKPSTQSSNAKELIFAGLESGYKIGTAGNKSVGRSSTIQYLHASEAALYKNASEIAAGIMQTVPNAPDTEIIIESTAKGVGNWFHQQWQMAEAGQSEFIPLFLPWYWDEGYIKPCDLDFKLDEEEVFLKDTLHLTNEQLNWRRSKIIEFTATGVDGYKLFKQEYPSNATEAFQTTGEDGYVSPELVMRARKNFRVEKYGPLILGVDPARFGDDRSALIRRRGRVVFGKETYIKKDTMELTGIIHRIIVKENPDAVCIDVGGLGAGIVDRLNELGHKDIVIPVNSGSHPLDSKKYANKRAEMWGTGKKWLEDEPCQLPDDDELQADICNTRYKIDSNSRLLMEKKEDMKKRGIRSSDCADSWLLTFAMPESYYKDANKKNDDKVKRVMRSFTNQQRLRRNNA